MCRKIYDPTSNHDQCARSLSFATLLNRGKMVDWNYYDLHFLDFVWKKSII